MAVIIARSTDVATRSIRIAELRHQAFWTSIDSRSTPEKLAALDEWARKQRRRRQTHPHKR